MKKVRVLIADDSALSRALLRNYLEQDEAIEVIAEACNGEEAVSLAQDLSPHIITMDVHMPKMDGLAAIEAIMTRRAVPILVVSSVDDAQMAYDALLRGALDVMHKPSVDSAEATQLVAKVKLLAGVSVFTRRSLGSLTAIKSRCEPLSRVHIEAAKALGFARVFAIACSTGGPQALASLLAALPAHFAAPIVVAQHMVSGFSQGMVDWLNRLTPLNVCLAKADDLLQAGCVYLAPSEYHLRVDASARLALQTPQSSDIYHPSCDQLLSSVAQSFGQRSVGLILTGMGKDGVQGIRDIYRQQGVTWAQDEASSVVFGMNRMAIEAGIICDVLSLESMPHRMMTLLD